MPLKGQKLAMNGRNGSRTIELTPFTTFNTFRDPPFIRNSRFSPDSGRQDYETPTKCMALKGAEKIHRAFLTEVEGVNRLTTDISAITLELSEHHRLSFSKGYSGSQTIVDCHIYLQKC